MTTSCGHLSCGFIIAMFVFLTISTHSACGQVDLTIQPGESGQDVVEATLARFKSSQTVDKLSNFNEFLRRVAYVQTHFGKDEDTFRDGYNGGIWQIDEDNFELTKSSPLADVLDLRTEIEKRFQIFWIQVPWVNLRKPLYSALAARLLISTFPDRPPNNAQIEDQANYWKLHYDTPNGQGTEDGFIKDVNELLDSERCFVSRLDLAFVVDGSGSVGQAHFDISKEFVRQIVDSFEIGPDRVRVGFIQYSSQPAVEFRLNDYMDKDTLLSDIDNITYIGGGTQTGLAINEMVRNLFGDERGARNVEENVPRLGIIMTDGKSSDAVLGPADNARAEGIILFAIGIGAGFDLPQLQEIANDPNDRYIFEVNNFDVVTNIQSLVSREACRAPIGLVLGMSAVQSLPIRSQIFVEFPLPPSNIMTVTLNATMGELSAYFSTQVTNPNPAFHQWSAHASEENPIAQVFINATEADPSRQKRQAEQQQVYGTITNSKTYISASDLPGVNGPDVNATIPEAVFTFVAEEGDTRIVIPITPTYTTSTIATPAENVTTGYTTSSSVVAENAITGYTTSSSVVAENAITDYTTSSSVVAENVSEDNTDIYVTENIRSAHGSRLSASGVAGITIIIFILLILIVIIVIVYLIKRRNTEVKTDAEATNDNVLQPVGEAKTSDPEA